MYISTDKVKKNRKKKGKSKKGKKCQVTGQHCARFSHNTSLNSHWSWSYILLTSQFEGCLSEDEKVGKFPEVILLLELEIKLSFDSKSHRLPDTPWSSHLRIKGVNHRSLCPSYIWGQEAFPGRTARADTLHAILLKNLKSDYFHLLVPYSVYSNIWIVLNCVLFKFTCTSIKVSPGFMSHSEVFPSCHHPPWLLFHSPFFLSDSASQDELELRRTWS